MEQTDWALNPRPRPPLTAVEDAHPRVSARSRLSPRPGCGMEKGKGPSSPRSRREGHLSPNSLSLTWSSGLV